MQKPSGSTSRTALRVSCRLKGRFPPPAPLKNSSLKLGGNSFVRLCTSRRSIKRGNSSFAKQFCVAVEQRGHAERWEADRGQTVKVLFATPEISDFVQVGGLAAVSAALPRALKGRADVRIIVPGYRQVMERIGDVRILGACPAFAALPACQIGFTHTSDGLGVYVVICPALFDRPGNPYADAQGADWQDNDIRFARFCAAAARVAAGLVDRSWRADLVHSNDWQAGLIAAYLNWSGTPIPSILTIHNLAYQGLFPKAALGRVGAPESAFHMEGVEFYDKFSFLKAGIVYASHLTTVSQTYAQEITTPEFGCGLEGILRKRAEAKELSGIVNGIDESWDPSRCADLATPFGVGDWDKRAANADHLRRDFGLSNASGPLFALVARLVHQKGVDLVLEAADAIVAAGGQIVVTGRGEARFEAALTEAQRRRPQAIAVRIGFCDKEARRIIAGSDFTLMPSRFEPCGLTQMYAQRFGSLPIGHRTGGLAETILDDETGFLFSRPSTESLLGSLCRAFSTFGSKAKLERMRRAAMTQTFDWSRSAMSYRKLYQAVI